MQQARRTAGSFFASLGGALGLSLLAHAATLTAVLWAMQPAASPAVARHKGAIMVTLATPTPRSPAISPRHVAASASRTGKATMASSRDVAARPAPPATPAPTPTLEEAAGQPSSMAVLPDPAPVPAAPHATATDAARITPSPSDTQAARPADTSSAQAPGAATSPSTAQPGARFSSLFAPVIARPMGRGRWRASPDRVPPLDALAQQEQALAGLRQALSARLAQMQASLLNTPLQGRCDIRIDLPGRRASMHCTDVSDEPRLWSMLDRIVAAGLLGHAAAPVCIHADANRIDWQDCALPAGMPPA